MSLPDRYRLGLRAELLQRLASGERLKHVCREAGMPDMSSVNGWMRADPGFAAEVAQARAQGAYRRRFVLDEAKAQAFLARVRAGEKIGDVLREPAMPSPATYRAWLAASAPFAEAMHAVRQSRVAEKAARMRGRFRPYDAAIGERIYVRLWKGERLRDILRSDKAFPALAVLARWRREEPAFEAMLQVAITGWRRKRSRARHGLTGEMEARVVSGIVAGGSLRSLSREPGMPCQRTLYNWCRTQPDFAELVAMACEDREDWYLAEAVKAAFRARGPASAKAAEKAVARLNAQRVRLRKRPGWKRARAAKPG